MIRLLKGSKKSSRRWKGGNQNWRCVKGLRPHFRTTCSALKGLFGSREYMNTSIYILHILLWSRIDILMSICVICVGQILEYLDGVFWHPQCHRCHTSYTAYTHILKKPNSTLVYIKAKNVLYLKVIESCGARLNHGTRIAIQIPHLPHYCEGW